MQIDLVPPLLRAAIGALGLGLVSLLAMWVFRIRSSAARHMAWTAVLVGMLLQIPLGLLGPTIPVTVLPHRLAPVQPPSVTTARTPLPITQITSSAIHTPTKPKLLSFFSAGTLTGVYLVISVLLFVRMAISSWILRRILRHATPISRLTPEVFESVAFVVPGSVGCFRPKIFLPVAWRDWDSVKLLAVLAHERAHIRRWDWLIRIASHINVCIFWFHPLAWWLQRELARLAEEACDDLALAEIENNERYAAVLIDIAQAVVAAKRVLNWQVISMAGESNVIRRVNRILNGPLQSPKPLNRFACAALLACSLPVIYLSAAVRFGPTNQHSPASNSSAAAARSTEVQPGKLSPKQKTPVKLIAQVAPDRPLPASPLAPSQDDVPIAMCILIDNSGSMRDKRPAVNAAALALVRASRPDDEVCVINFNDEAFIDLTYTGDIQKMETALTRIDSRGGKAIWDSVRMSIDHMERRSDSKKKVLVLVTGGNDSASTTTQEQLLSRVKNSSVHVYSIGLISEHDPDQAEASMLPLRQLAEASSGVAYSPKDLAQIENLSPDIANAIRKR